MQFYAYIAVSVLADCITAVILPSFQNSMFLQSSIVVKGTFLYHVEMYFSCWGGSAIVVEIRATKTIIHSLKFDILKNSKNTCLSIAALMPHQFFVIIYNSHGHRSLFFSRF